jgi:hemerythrin-like domain-containing protein
MWRISAMAWNSFARRDFLGAAAGAGGLLLFSGCKSASPQKMEGSSSGGSGVSPTEDLMQEHGLLNRQLLIYEECIHRLRSGGDFDPKPLADSVALVEWFVHGYHEKLEEDFIFPRFRAAGRQGDLVGVLLAQHEAGRCVTNEILELLAPPPEQSQEWRKELSDKLRLFVRMYRPHEAREDTVLYPLFRGMMTPGQMGAMADEFESLGRQRFGQDGFPGLVERTATIEMQLGIYDLRQFYP